MFTLARRTLGLILGRVIWSNVGCFTTRFIRSEYLSCVIVLFLWLSVYAVLVILLTRLSPYLP